MRQRDEAICLRAIDYSETSQVLHFLTRSAGLLHLLAKGSKRPKGKSGGAVDLLSEGDVVFIESSGGGLGTLVEFTETVSHTALRRDAARLNSSLYMLELVGDLLGEGDPQAEIFDLLHKALARLHRAESSPKAVLAYFQWRLLRMAGLLGDLRQCVVCNRVIIAAAGPQVRSSHFSSRQGGLLCDEHQHEAAEKVRLDAATLAGIWAVLSAQAQRKVDLPDQQADAVNCLLAYHAMQQLGKPLKTARYAMSGLALHGSNRPV